MQKALFTLGPFTVYYFGLTVAIGVILAIALALREAPRRGLDPGKVADFSLYSVMAGLLGARVLFVLFAWEYYRANPGEIIRLSAGGMSIYGGLIAGLAVAILFCRRNRLSIWRLGDVVAPSIALGEAVGRIGCDIYGKPTNWPFAIEIAGVSYHNIPLYSTVAMGLLFVWLWRRRTRARFDGQILLEFMIGCSVARFVIEFARESVLLFGPFSWAQVACVAAFALAVALWPGLSRRGYSLK